MIPFRDYELRSVLANADERLNKYVDGLSNDEIMANDLEILSENCYSTFSLNLL